MLALNHKMPYSRFPVGVELPNALQASRYLLQKGFIILPAGPQAEVLAITPPFTISYEQLDFFVECLVQFQEENKTKPH